MSRTSLTASARTYGRASTFDFAARNFLPLLGIILLRRASDPVWAESPTVPREPCCESLNDVDSHRACGAFDHPDGGRKVRGVQVRHLRLGDLLDLLFRELADLLLVGRAGALGHPGGLEQ